MNDPSPSFEQQERRLAAWRRERAGDDSARERDDDLVFHYLANQRTPAFPARFTAAIVEDFAARRRNAARFERLLVAIGGLSILACIAIALPALLAARWASWLASLPDVHLLVSGAILLGMACLGTGTGRRSFDRATARH